MSAGVLSFQEYVGGPDEVIVEQTFPSNQRTLVYNFGRDVTGWTFEADYQTIVVDEIQFNRTTGKPNFGKSSVIGSFAKEEVVGEFVPTVVDAVNGIVNVHFQAQMYDGPIIPDARKNVPITVFGITWTDDQTPAQVSTHRWALVQCWEPDVPVGDPTTVVGYTALTLGA